MKFFGIEMVDGMVRVPGPVDIPQLTVEESALPATVVLKDATQTLTNKTIDTADNDITVAQSDVTGLTLALALKLDASTYTPADVLSKLLTVDGAGSGLDADLLDGNTSSAFVLATTYTAADVLAKLLTVDGAASGLDADLLDGLSSAAFSLAGHTHAAAGSDTEVQFNDATVIGASSAFTYNKTTNIVQLGTAATPGSVIAPQGAATSAGVSLLVSGGAGGATSGTGGTLALVGGIPTDGVGGSVSIVGRAGATTTATNRNGGAVSLSAGAAALGGTGGAITATAAAGGTTGIGGAVTISGGAGGTTSGNAGSATLQGGLPVDGNGGSVSITGRAGVGTNRSGGNVNLTGGAATGSGTPGAVVAAGNVSLSVAGNKLLIKEGTNASMGVVTLVAGAAVVNTTLVTANSRIFLTCQALGTVAVPTARDVTARVAGTSFTITSAAVTDTSIVAWHIIEPA